VSSMADEPTRGAMMRAFWAGVLAANSLPHLATAATGREHMTPLTGPASNRWVNLAWGAANLIGGLALVGLPATGRRWGRDLVAFDAGAAAFAVWMAASEAFLEMNTTAEPPWARPGLTPGEGRSPA
jgi:hypothetical protein